MPTSCCAFFARFFFWKIASEPVKILYMFHEPHARTIQHNITTYQQCQQTWHKEHPNISKFGMYRGLVCVSQVSSNVSTSWAATRAKLAQSRIWKSGEKRWAPQIISATIITGKQRLRVQTKCNPIPAYLHFLFVCVHHSPSMKRKGSSFAASRRTAKLIMRQPVGQLHTILNQQTSGETQVDQPWSLGAAAD